MSIFAKVAEKKAEEDQGKLVERYNHLLTYAGILGVDVESIGARIELADGLTMAKLNDFQMLIESANDKAEMQAAKREPFAVDSWERVDWFMRKQIELAAVVDAQKAQLTKMVAEQKAFAGLFEQQAKDFAMAEYKRTETKTVKRQFGDIVVTNYKPAWKITDESKLQEWIATLKAGDLAFFECYPKTYSRNLDKIKDNAKKGAIFPLGVEEDPGGDKVSIRYPKTGGGLKA